MSIADNAFNQPLAREQKKQYKAACEREVQAIARSGRTKPIVGIFDVMENLIDQFINTLPPAEFVAMCLSMADDMESEEESMFDGRA